MITKKINIEIEAKMMNDFIGHAGSLKTAKKLLNNWIFNYVNEKNNEDREMLENKNNLHNNY